MAKRILFVEDETHIAELYAFVLRKEGYEVDIKGDGAEGLKAAQNGDYELILLDLMLPTMSGLDILHALNDSTKSPNFRTPVVILTNLGEDDATAAEINQYAQGYLLKVDVTPKQLADYVAQNWLGKNSQPKAA